MWIIVHLKSHRGNLLGRISGGHQILFSLCPDFSSSVWLPFKGTGDGNSPVFSGGSHAFHLSMEIKCSFSLCSSLVCIKSITWRLVYFSLHLIKYSVSFQTMQQVGPGAMQHFEVVATGRCSQSCALCPSRAKSVWKLCFDDSQFSAFCMFNMWTIHKKSNYFLQWEPCTALCWAGAVLPTPFPTHSLGYTQTSSHSTFAFQEEKLPDKSDHSNPAWCSSVVPCGFLPHGGERKE